MGGTTNLKISLFMAILVVAVVGSNAAGKTIYVDADANGFNDGSSWVNAYNYLQDALADAIDGDQIWVAQGTYNPDQGSGNTSGDREATFQLINGVAIYGGFPSGGSVWENRDPKTYETTLSGDLNGDDIGFTNNGENSLHVVTGSGTGTTPVLDGFTITAGNANGAEHAARGGGMYNYYGSPKVTNCKFIGNWGQSGSAVVNWGDSMMFTNCTFCANSGLASGAIFNVNGNSTLTNCLFSGNSSGTTGGAINNAYGNLTVVNCTFSGNSADTFGGGMYNFRGNAVLTNCVFWGNIDDNGNRTDESAQVHHYHGPYQGTLTINYSCVQGWTHSLGGTGNIGGNPLFVDANGPDNVLGTQDDNLRFIGGSPCVDAGDNNDVPSDTLDLDGDSDINEPIPHDLDGNPRFLDDPCTVDTGNPGELGPPIVDMGAYEGTHQCFLLSPEVLAVPEGHTATFTVALALDPAGTVEVSVTHESGDPDITVVSGELLIFNSSNYSIPKIVTLAAAEDGDYLYGTALIYVNAIGFFTSGITAIEWDNDAPSILYVDSDAPSVGDGTTWTNAFKDLQEALKIAVSIPEVGEVRVAQGTYWPTGPSGDREATFKLVNGVTIKGGYAGFGEPDSDARDVRIYRTILSGDLNGDDGPNFANNEENCYHVTTASETDATAVLDGFIITASNANESRYTEKGRGGGMYNFFGSPTLKNCIFTKNWAYKGAGMYIVSESNPTLTNCTFFGNVAGDEAGGMYSGTCSPTLTNCIFSGNSAEGFGGGISGRIPAIINCTFYCNSAGYRGGGLWNPQTSNITNCIFWGNTAPEGSQIGLDYDDLVFSYCNIQGGKTAMFVQQSSVDWGKGNIDVNPNLTPDGHLRSGSPCVNAGDPNFVTGPGAPNDIDCEDRIINGRVEIGADEFLDVDDDRLPDFWEQMYFGDPNIADPNGDPDGDGIDNMEEYEVYSSNPNAIPCYVDASRVGDPLADGTFAHPFATIQEGLDSAEDGDTICVLAGIYSGPNNVDIDFDGKLVVLYASDGPNDTIIDCNGEGRGFDFNSGETHAAALVGFTITNGQANYGGAIRCDRSHPQIRDCVITDNNDPNEGAGGIYCYLSTPTLADCNISNNSPDGVRVEYGGVWIDGTVQLASNNWVGHDLMLYGEGTLLIASDATLNLDDSVIRCNLSGTGIVYVVLGSELIIEGASDINLAHESDPNQNGEIQCDGLLLVRDSVHLSNANIQVNRASFEGDVDISNSIITAEAGSPYGQFFIEDTVHIAGNDIHADGDRYMDLDPSVFAGVIANNRIFVTITEGVGNTRGGLLELRGSDGLVSGSSCDPNNEFFCEVNDVPVFDTNSWMIEQLEVVEGAKVNLTNRFDFGNGGLYEVMYVKDLILGSNSVLNTAFNQLYYQNLIGDSNSVRNEPLLGFSLSNIALDNNNEFLTRVTHNNFIDPDPSPPDYTRIHVKRVDGNEPDPNGMMRMRNLRDINNQVINARAKGLFAKANEDEILIRFEYLFGSSGPNVELVIYLSDVPELLDHSDPCRLVNYLVVARLYPPPPGQYGSVGSDHLGVFEKVVSAGNLNFIRGVRMELELAGPEGTCILINNWDPYVSCIYCGDVTGDHGVTPRDYLTVLGESGELSSGHNRLGMSLDCLEEFGFSDDGFLDATDLMGWDWGQWLASEGLVSDLCFDIRLAPPDFNESTGGSDLLYGATSTIAPEAGGATGFAGSLLIGGKRFDAGQQDFLSDRLYNFDESCNLVGGPYALHTDRMNGKLVRDHNDLLYQINVEEGLVRFSDLSSVIPRGQGYSVGSEPRYEQPATIYVGFQDQGDDTWGRPILDAAFDAQGDVYVTPVVVVPDVCDPYLASAKLMLATGQSPPYNVVEIYDDPPLPNNNQDCNNLSEIELDDYGNVYVINSGYANGSDILWLYDSNGVVRKRGLQSLGIYGPVGLCCSVYDNSLLYVASSKGEPDAGSASLYALSTDNLTLVQSIDINDMGHITDITEDPVTGTVWVAGFTMPQYINYLPAALSQMSQFYHPYLAAVSYGSSGPVQATQLSNAADLALPLSIAWVGAISEKCGVEDLDGLGDVNFGDLVILVSQWLQPPGTPSADIAPIPNGDGIVNFLDLAVLAGHWMETCGP